MSIQSILSDREVLKQFQKAHPEHGSIPQIVALSEETFVQTYADTLKGGAREARRIHQLAIAIQQQAALVWANLKDLASPFAANTLFNNVPESFLDFQQTIPGYDRLFGNLDYIDCDPCRSIFGPAAYFVDLMRFVEQYITRQNPIPEDCQLQYRRPDLFNLRLDCENTSDLIAYIDLVNEVLETLVATPAHPDAAQVLEEASFPSDLPYNRPLDEIRTYLSQLSLSLTELYQTFDPVSSENGGAIARERLSLSPREREIIESELRTAADFATFYGVESVTELDNVTTFLEQTGLTRQELTELIFQDLSQAEVNAGLSRHFFINQADDGLDHLWIEAGDPTPNSFYQVPQERLVNLSPAKLDRIYRFVKLARRLEWSFADLDWALRSLQLTPPAPRGLYFNGQQDSVTVSDVAKLDLASFTLEAWIHPDQAKVSPILYKGTGVNPTDATQTHFWLGLGTTNQLVFHGGANDLHSASSLPLGVFSHVAVTVSDSQVRFYINGKLDSTHNAAPVAPAGSTLSIGTAFGYEFFAGILQEVRIWQGGRSLDEIAAHRYRRLTGRETDLVGYWPLTEEDSGVLSDRTPNPAHGLFHGRADLPPTWVVTDLTLDPFPTPVAEAAFEFNGVDQYLAAEGVRDLAITDQLTLEAWVNPSQSQLNPIFRIGTGDFRVADTRRTELELRLTDANQVAIALGETILASEEAIAPNTFTHIAVTITGTQARFYLNGVARGTATLPAPLTIQGTEIEIGRNLAGNHFAGQLREVRVWNRLRTPEQLQQTLYRVLPTRAPGLVGYWRLNQADEGVAIDLAIHENHLLLGGIAEEFQPDPVPADRLLPEGAIALTSSILALDGANDLIVVSNPQNAGLGQYERFTLELWFRPVGSGEVAQETQADRVEHQQVIYSQGDAAQGLVIYLIGQRLTAMAWCEEAETGVLQKTLFRSEALPLDVWHHVAVTHDETQPGPTIEFRAYLDGVELQLSASNHPDESLPAHQKGYRLSPTGVAYLGGIGLGGITRFASTLPVEEAGFNHPALYHFRGSITDVRLWNRVKSADEIAQERFAAPDAADTRLIAYLPMTEGNGTVLRDPGTRPNPSQGTLQLPDLGIAGDRLELRNVHSYYSDPDALTWTNYLYTGTLALTDAAGAIGVTVFNADPENQGPAYILRRTAQQPTFHLASWPDSAASLTGTLDSTVDPAVDTEYAFRVEVTSGSDATTIRAKIWPDGTPEPEAWQIDAQDQRSDRPIAGTVGIWAADKGQKFFANLHVERLFLSDVLGNRPDQAPAAWRDTGANFSTAIDDTLFDILGDRFPTPVFGTESNRPHIHSHYAAPAALAWNHYEYTGRLRTDHPSGAVGVTVFSGYPANETRYYRLRAWGQRLPFSLETRAANTDPENGTRLLEGTAETNIPLLHDVWYRFRIAVADGESRTTIRAKVWREDEAEPVNWQMDAYDDRPDRPRAGTVGLWAASAGAKFYDDLRVFQPQALLASTPNATDLSRFQTAGAAATAPWFTTDDYPLLQRPLNLQALRLNGRGEYLAAATADETSLLNLYPFAIEAWVNLVPEQQPHPILAWRSGGETPESRWFGVNGEGRLAIAHPDPTQTITGTAAVPTGAWTHLAVSVENTTVTFYINGVEDGRVELAEAIALNAALLELGRNGANQHFAGDIRDVRVWKTARTADQFAIAERYQQPDPTHPDLAAYWPFPEMAGEITQDAASRGIDLRLGGLELARQPVVVNPSPDAAAIAPVISLDATSLERLAVIQQLRDRHPLSIERLTALWFEIRHTGREDGITLFDRLFNPPGLQREPWTYSQIIRWDVTGQEDAMRSREIRTRLMAALQVSSEDLDRLVQRLSGDAPVLVLDSRYLTRLYHLSQTAKVVRLTVADFLTVLDWVGIAEINTLEEFRQVSDRALQLQRLGISIDELTFLANDSSQDSRIRLPFTDAAVRDLADTLARQSTELLVRSVTFATDDLTEAQSARIGEVLQAAGWIDGNGAVIRSDRPDLTSLTDLPTNADAVINETLSRLHNDLGNAVLAGLSELLGVEAEPLQAVMTYLRVPLFGSDRTLISAPHIMDWMLQIFAAPEDQPIPPALLDYLYYLSKALYLVIRFTLSTVETRALLQNPAQFSVTDVLRPSLTDLENLRIFTELRTAFNDGDGNLVRVLQQTDADTILDAIQALSGWERRQIVRLMAHFGELAYNRVEGLSRLQQGFAIATLLQVNIDFVLQLSDTRDLTLPFYQQQSVALLNVLRARYDEEQWEQVYPPLRDRLATRKRDALLSYALPRQIDDSFAGRRDADLLYEYLLLDVQIGSEVQTSRIVQGTAALQLYVQRCLMNLEKGVNPATIPADEWEWMKNYRVWEANRKVFLYPESFIEPELRDTKTPQFEELEQELLQNEINRATVEQAFTNYLNKVTELADLKIVGSYLHRDVEILLREQINGSTLNPIDFDNGIVPDSLRSLIQERGITLSADARIEPIYDRNAPAPQNRPRWRMMDSVDNELFYYTIQQDETQYVISVSNQRDPDETLYLVGRTPTQPHMFYYRELVNGTRWLPWKKIDLGINAEFVTPVLAFNRLFLFWVEFVEANRPNPNNQTNTIVYRPIIRYSYLNLMNTWVQPQTYAEVERELLSEERFRAEFQRVYALATFFEVRSPAIERRERIIVIYDNPDQVGTLRDGRDRELFTLQHRDQAAVNYDLGLSLVYLGRLDMHLAVPLFRLATGNFSSTSLLPTDNLSREESIARVRETFARIGLRLTDNFTVSTVDLHSWIVNDDNKRYLYSLDTLFQPIVHDFSRPFLHVSRSDGSNINNYHLASAPELDLSVSTPELSQLQSQLQDDPTNSELMQRFENRRLETNRVFNSSARLLRTLPSETSLMDINNRPGWYVLDTGEEQFLIRVQTDQEIGTDGERLEFPLTVPQTAFSFTPDPALAVIRPDQTPQYRFERLDTSAVRELNLTLFRDGIDGLLSLRSQQLPERNFDTYGPSFLSIAPGATTPNGTTTIDFEGAFGLYYEEIFFHIPFLIANQLNANQNFAEAQRWYHYIFNPTTPESNNGNGNGAINRDRYWQYLPFREQPLKPLDQILSNQAALDAYRRDPFDPHAIARLRVNAYQKAIVMKYIDNLLDWGDTLFTQNTRESINEAALLYVLAFNLLGPRPEARANRAFEAIGDYNAIRQELERVPDFLTDFTDRNGASDNGAGGNGSLPLPQNGAIVTTFCVTENTDFVGFWDRVEDRLFKIRHSLNIEGIFRQLPLFQPPLDVRALVQAVAAGGRDLGSILSDLETPVPHYRFPFMLERAKEMTAQVISLGSALLEAIQNRDAEQLTLLENTHERAILELMTSVHELARNEAQETLDALQISQRNIQNRLTYFTNTIEQGLLPEEATELTLTGLAQIPKGVSGLLQLTTGFIQATPEASVQVTLGLPPSVATGIAVSGDNLAAPLDGAAELIATTADIIETTAALVGKAGEYRRRLNEWVLERQTAEFDLAEINQQIAIATLQRQIAEQELVIHRRTIEQNQQIAEFHRRKFTNEALYNWMITRLSGLYFQAYRLAYSMARSAERAYQYEFGTGDRLINFGHWDNLRRGLLAGESLMLELSRLEKTAIDQDSRYQEIEKTISLKRTFPEAFLNLLRTGTCTFELGERMFNQDYPGHYFRIIRALSMTVKSPSLEPDESLNATLIQLGNRTLLAPDIGSVRYLMGGEGATPPTGNTLRVNWRANQQIAVSKQREDYGMFGNFDINFRFDDRYFPFEGTGVLSNWELEMPQATAFTTENLNGVDDPNDVESLRNVDVVIQLRYMSKFDRGNFRQQVQEVLQQIR
ncbi:MAG: LamG-like jellyroll fold domain-containing protein [Synechococcales bacterium]|nr:LamG-like jellyroll fold domain-containing protein [Synechococcales bacterium]